MSNFICDLCGQSFQDLGAVRAHLAEVHQVDDAAELGSMEQRDGILTLRNGGEETVIDLGQWLANTLRAQEREGQPCVTPWPATHEVKNDQT